MKRDGKPKLEHEEGHQRDEMLQRGLSKQTSHAFLKGFQDDRRLLLHVSKAAPESYTTTFCTSA